MKGGREFHPASINLALWRTKDFVSGFRKTFIIKYFPTKPETASFVALIGRRLLGKREGIGEELEKELMEN
jgi:hypothetical protein